MAIAKKQRDRKAMDAEIKNTLSGGIGEFELFFAEHWKALVIGGLAVVVAIGCVYGGRSWVQSSQRKAQNALASAKTAEQLEKALQNYGSDSSAVFARIRLARLYMEANKIKEADAQYKALETSGLPPEKLLRVKIDRGYLQEKAGDVKGAAAHFAACALTPGAAAGLRAEAEFAAGRLYTALKNKDLAKKHLENCIRLQNQVGMGGQQWVSFAQFLLRGE